ncbi:MAG: FkbM family methyltransferase [Candidatus Pacebacteria bacterium]|nr:FkbM family methyltransferase [Candidatus Paceibacterota bacterium]
MDRFCRDRSIEQIDLLKLDIQGHEYAALQGCSELVSAGRLTTVFMELNWATTKGNECPATESICMLERAGYKFSVPEKALAWREAGEWLSKLSDVIASRKWTKEEARRR